MGSSSSRLGTRPSRPRVNRSKLCSLICGGSTSRATHRMEDYPAQFQVTTGEYCDPVCNDVRDYTDQTSLMSNKRTDLSCPHSEPGTSCERSVREELVLTHQVSTDYIHDEFHRNDSDTASTSFKEQQSLDSVSVNVLENKDISQIRTGITLPSSSAPQRVGEFCSSWVPNDNLENEVISVNNGDSESIPNVSNAHIPIQSPGDESIHEGIPSGIGIAVSNRVQGQRDESVLHVDVVRFSSSILASSSRGTTSLDAQRNSRRVFWDAFSRRSSRRRSGSPNRTFVFSLDDADDMGHHDRWHLDLTTDFSDDEAGGDFTRYRGSRIRGSNGQRRPSRSEVRESLRNGLNENSQRSSYCPSGLHPEGTCSCESLLMTDDTSTHVSISRIIMLAGTLFEVLDEIHRQPVSLALSMVSLPAPESVVDSFPLKNHRKTLDGGDDNEQCYICLAEYEEGDKIRILPCHHEYHMSCVDKWLKEIHGVCPLCRGDVREGFGENSAINTEISPV